VPTTKFKIVKKGDQFCVADPDGSPIQGGKGSCHANRADAVKQLRAIYAQKGKTFSEKSLYVPTKQFSSLLESVNTPGDELPWIQIFPFGHWSHPVYGDDAAVVSYDTAARYVKNFNDNVRRQDIAIDYEHGEDKAKGNKASGWYRAMELRDDGVYAQIEFTEPAKQEIKNGEWRYFSPLFVDLYEDAETNEVFEDVIIGGGLTNRPWMKDMVPINFSEAVLEEKTIKYRFKDGRWIASDNDGDNWRTATEAEVAELEHSEPGTGSPPQPRTDEEDRSGDKDGQGIRRDTPPPQDNKEGSNMKLSADALKLLGLPEDADEAAIETAITTSFAQLPQLKEFAEKNAKAKKFSEEFPEEFKRMQELALAEAGRASKAFAESYERVTHTEGTDDNKVVSKTNRGPSAIVLSGIETFHKRFSEGDATMDDFKGLMDTIFTDKAFVDYGEVGSSRQREDSHGDGSDVAKAFAEKVQGIMVEYAGKGTPVSWEVAVSEGTTRYPDLAKAYAERPIPSA
jgi:hypothetical protein